MSSNCHEAVGGSTNSPVFVKRRQRISQAAVRLFTEHAYADVHMDAIAAAAGVTKPTLYRYFATKEALFIEALECALEELRHEIRALRSGTGSVEERFRRVVACVLDRVGRLTPAIRAVEGQSSDLGERSRAVLRRGSRPSRTRSALFWWREPKRARSAASISMSRFWSCSGASAWRRIRATAIGTWPTPSPTFF